MVYFNNSVSKKSLQHFILSKILTKNAIQKKKSITIAGLSKFQNYKKTAQKAQKKAPHGCPYIFGLVSNNKLSSLLIFLWWLLSQGSFERNIVQRLTQKH